MQEDARAPLPGERLQHSLRMQRERGERVERLKARGGGARRLEDAQQRLGRGGGEQGEAERGVGGGERADELRADRL